MATGKAGESCPRRDLLKARAARSGLAPGMASEEPTVDQIVKELLEESLTKAERMQRFKELVRRGADVPDQMLDLALKRLMERLAE